MHKNKRKEAFNLFRINKGKITNTAIANELGLSPGTVGSWKKRDAWIENTAGEFRNVPKKAGAIAKEKTFREKTRENMIESLSEINGYSTSLDMLIDLYIDSAEEYRQAKENGAQTMQLRKEMARLLSQLGLDGKNKELLRRSGALLGRPEGKEEALEEAKAEAQESSKLVQFRQKVGR